MKKNCEGAKGLGLEMEMEIVHFALKMRWLKAQQLATIFEMENGKSRKLKHRSEWNKLKRLKWNLLDLYTFNLHS